MFEPVGTTSRRVRMGRDDALAKLVPWLIAALAICALYFAQTVLIPIMLAGLLSFLLAPIVGVFRRIGVPRLPSVAIAVVLALGALAATTAVLVSQAATLSKDAPAYAERITEKSQRVSTELRRRFDFILRESRGGGSDHPVTRRARSRAQTSLPAETANGALPVEVWAPPPTALQQVAAVVKPALAPLETTLIVFIVTIFFLIQKQDLRDRVIRLMGAADLHRTTAAFDDGAQRLSRYFFAQFVVNAGFGLVVWAGLFLIGVPAPALWGILAALLRFVPYIGTVIALVGPLALAAAVDPGWGLAAQVALLFIVVEPVIGYIIEPLFYGHSTGLSPVSVIVAALFWTWIWGPVGLVLSMPLTLTLVVLGRHIPAFAVFDILLGDQPALSPAETFYQRVLAGNPDEAIDEAEAHLQASGLASYYDDVVLAALRLAAADVDRGAVARSALAPVGEAACEVITALADYQSHQYAVPPPAAGCAVVCIPGRGPLDAAISAMTAQLLRQSGCTVREVSRDQILGDALATGSGGTGDALCFLGLFDTRGAARMQPLLASIATRVPGGRIVLGVCRSSDVSADETPLAVAPAVSLAALCAAVVGTDSGSA